MFLDKFILGVGITNKIGCPNKAADFFYLYSEILPRNTFKLDIIISIAGKYKVKLYTLTTAL